VYSSPTAEKIEVGILSNEKPKYPSELNLSGFLTVVGDDDTPKATMFSFPSRHHSLLPAQANEQKYAISFLHPTGLHPTMQISFPNAVALHPPSNRPPSSVCGLHAYLTVPSALFADKYQLATTDHLFLDSHNLVALRAISGETDLEAADYAVEKWGSNLLFELAVPPNSSLSGEIANPNESTRNFEWNVTIPLHLRYLSPAPSGHSTVDVPWPTVFWACTAEEGAKFPVNPFDRVNLGYDGLFGPRTMFYHLNTAAPPASASDREDYRLTHKLSVPVLNTSGWWWTVGGGESFLQWSTMLAIVAGFAWVCWCLVAGPLSNRSAQKGEERQKQMQKQKKKKVRVKESISLREEKVRGRDAGQGAGEGRDEVDGEEKKTQ
jgi:hypothetical protein